MKSWNLSADCFTGTDVLLSMNKPVPLGPCSLLFAANFVLCGLVITDDLGMVRPFTNGN